MTHVPPVSGVAHELALPSLATTQTLRGADPRCPPASPSYRLHIRQNGCMASGRVSCPRRLREHAPRDERSPRLGGSLVGTRRRPSVVVRKNSCCMRHVRPRTTNGHSSRLATPSIARSISPTQSMAPQTMHVLCMGGARIPAGQVPMMTSAIVAEETHARSAASSRLSRECVIGKPFEPLHHALVPTEAFCTARPAGIRSQLIRLDQGDTV